MFEMFIAGICAGCVIGYFGRCADENQAKERGKYRG
jgi:hypothetical protein